MVAAKSLSTQTSMGEAVQVGRQRHGEDVELKFSTAECVFHGRLRYLARKAGRLPIILIFRHEGTKGG